MTAAGYSSVTRLPKALDGDELKEAIKGVHLLGIRSRTQITAEVVEAADRLIAIGCFSVGTNQVDVDASRRNGIPVFNAPFSNTRSVAELVIGEIVLLLRRIVARSNAAHEGSWDKSADRQPRGQGQDARHHRLRQHRLAAVLSRRSDGHAGGVLRPYRQAPPRQHRADRQPARAPGAERRRQHACAGNAGDAGHDRARRDRGDEARRLFHQQQPRHRRRPRRARRGPARGQAARRRGRRLSGRAGIEHGTLHIAAAGARQRHPDAACRRLDRGGAGAHRRRSRAQARRLQRHRIDDGSGQLSLRRNCRRGRQARDLSRFSATCRACSDG